MDDPAKKRRGPLLGEAGVAPDCKQERADCERLGEVHRATTDAISAWRGFPGVIGTSPSEAALFPLELPTVVGVWARLHRVGPRPKVERDEPIGGSGRGHRSR